VLGHPAGGALAVVGHVERTWGYSFLWKGVGPITQAFEQALGGLLAGQPVGLAMEPFARRAYDLADDLHSDGLPPSGPSPMSRRRMKFGDEGKRAESA
jgi:hypothetical protein